jgi:hypothetical protein
MLGAVLSLEIEARFTSKQGGELLLIAWFEGASAARLVLTGPAGEREEVQIKKIGVSLIDEVQGVLAESVPPGNREGPVTARLQLATDRARVGRSVRLGNRESKADGLCGKLVAMADLLSKDEGVRRKLDALKQHLAG